MKRLAIAIEYPLEVAGGVSVLAKELIRGLSSRCRIVLVSGDTPEEFAASPVKPAIERHIPWQINSRDPRQGKELARLIAVTTPDLAHFHFGANFGWRNRFPWQCPIPPLARLGVPIVSTIHMVAGPLHEICGPRKPLWFKLGFLPWASVAKLAVLRHIRREIAVSRQDYRRLRRWYWPMHERFTQIYHSRIDAEAIDPGGSSEREKTVLCVGHFARRKGQVVLAEAFAAISSRYPEWSLKFAGHVYDDACQAEVLQAAKRCARPDQIQLLGQQENTAELMRNAAVFVQPSFFEGLPLALQEALFHGCACLATDIPGNDELIEHDVNGWLVAPKDAEAMTAGLEKLLSDPGLRTRLSGQGRPSILRRQMTRQHMVEKHVTLYESVLALG